MQKGFAHLLLILVIFFFISAAGALYYWQNSKSPRSQDSPGLSLDTSTPISVEREEAVYKNDSLGFEFVVPEGFSIVEENEDEFHERSNGQMRKNFTDTLYYPPAEFVTSLYVLNSEKNYEDAPLSVWVFENPNNLGPEAFYNKYWYYPFIWGDFTSAKNNIAPTQKISIGEASASGSVVNYRIGNPYFIYLPKDDKMFLFRTKEGGKILDTFKFNP